jgi:hypothetical protein
MQVCVHTTAAAELALNLHAQVISFLKSPVYLSTNGIQSFRDRKILTSLEARLHCGSQFFGGLTPWFQLHVCFYDFYARGAFEKQDLRYMG